MKTCNITVLGILCLCTFVLCLNDFPVTKYSLIDTTTKNTSNIFKVGLLGNFLAGDAGVGVTHFAIEAVNSDPTILPGCLLQLYFCQTDGSKAQALISTETLIQEYNVSALVGARTSDETEISNIVASIYSVPQIGAISVSPALSDKSIYSYFMRVNPPAQYQNSALISLMLHEGWEQVFIIYSNDPYGIGGLNDLQEQATGLNLTFLSTQITNGASNYSSLVETMQQSISESRTRIWVIYTQANDGLVILENLNAAGLIGENTYNLYVMMDAITVGFITNQYDISHYPYLQGSIGVVARGPVPGTQYTDVVAAWSAANTTRFPGVRPDPTQSWYYYDAVYTIARALDKLLQVKPLENVTGKDLLGMMTTNIFTGVTGKVAYDANFDRKGDYVWYNFRATFNESFAPDQLAAIYSPLFKNTTYVAGVPLMFNGKLSQPDGVCPCDHGTCDGMDVCHCSTNYGGPSCNTYIGKGGGLDTKDLAPIIAVPVIVIGLVFMAAVLLVRHKRKALIKDMTDKQRALIKRSDISLQERIGRGASGEVFKGMFRGTEVAVKKVVTSISSSATTEQFEMECAIMTALRHPNIVLFMGMCLLPENNELLLVMELMERGSLHDSIHNKKVQLSQSLCLHIAYQAAKGMNFLHQSDPPIIHCDLKSHNILMDDKWNARISDFGITRFKKLNSNNKKTPGFKGGASSLGTIYWTAPEVFAGSSHIEASDCYSFGIVLWELFHRETPYGGKEPMLVANEVQNNVRPRLKDDMDPTIRDLITDCWAAEPSARPTFETIMNRLRLLNLQNPLTSFGSHEHENVEAPTGTVYLVATETVGASDLWDGAPMAMSDAMKMHNQYIRHKIENNDGYEVESNQNGFLVAFRTVKDAVNFCLLSQVGLLQLEWPAILFDYPAARIESAGSQVLYAGLHVRMVIHMGVPGCVNDQFGRMKYIGPVVERTRKLLSSATSGSIIVSNQVLDHIHSKGVKFAEEISVVTIGETLDSARSTQSARNKLEKVFDILPKPLAGRRDLVRSPAANVVPNAVILDMDDEVATNELQKVISSKRPLSWEIHSSDMTEKESMGKGAIGDYIRTSWKGKEVAQKVLLNQQIGEDDLFVLKARSAVLTKVQHKNLVQFYGVCLEPGHISLIIEYIPKAVGLQALLSDNSISLSFATKVKLAKQIAEGMYHLNSIQGQPWLSTHGNLKSNNVLVEKDGMNAKVSDFGQGTLKDLARTMTSVGTVAWTAPELLNGEDPTPKISIYSFGIIMWELYTRSFPYHDEHPIKVVTKIVAGYRPTIPADCPEKYRELMAQCWTNEPDQRPSWGEILSVLSSL